jgi:hypothetical protein
MTEHERELEKQLAITTERIEVLEEALDAVRGTAEFVLPKSIVDDVRHR